MKITGLPSFLAKISTTKTGQKVYKSMSNKENFLNNTLPLISSGVCTGSYIYATATDKKIPDERRPILQWQNVLNFIAGVAISAPLNKYASKKGEQVIKELKPELVKGFEDVSTGIRIAIPMVITSLVFRLGVSSGSVLVSDWCKRITDKYKKSGVTTK